MRKLVILAVVMLSANVLLAQNEKNTYVLEGDLIQATLFHDNGAIAQTGYYTLENKLQGEWTSYDRSGEKTATAHYENGIKVGTWKFFKEDTMKEVTYLDARIFKVKTWTVTDTRVVSN